MSNIVKAEPSAREQYEAAAAIADQRWAAVEAAFEVADKASKAHLAAIDAYSQAVKVCEEKRVEAFK